MNVQGYAGFWIWGSTSGAARAANYTSWGLMQTLPARSTILNTFLKVFGARIRKTIGG